MTSVGGHRSENAQTEILVPIIGELNRSSRPSIGKEAIYPGPTTGAASKWIGNDLPQKSHRKGRGLDPI